MTKTNVVDMTQEQLSALGVREFIRLTRAHFGIESKSKEVGVDLSDVEVAEAITDPTGEALEHARQKADLSHGGGDMADRIEVLLLGQSGVDFSEKSVEDLSDDEVYEGYKSELSGEAGAKRHERKLVREQAEELEHWLHEHKAGNPIPRDREQHLLDLGLIS